MLSAVGVSLNTPMAPLVVFMDPRLLESVFSIIIGSAEGAFLQVTVFVGAVLLLFGFFNFRSHGALIRTIQERKQWQPVIGAFLGLTPGCGGAIFIMPLYLKGSVTFGTVVATLIATAGDSAFVVISKLPLHFVDKFPLASRRHSYGLRGGLLRRRRELDSGTRAKERGRAREDASKCRPYAAKRGVRYYHRRTE